jgi:flagellar protein FlbD
MILLHHLGREHEEFVLNCELICTVEATPDTTLSLTTGSRLMVSETVEEVVAAVRAWRAGIMAEALRASHTSNYLLAR